MFFFGLSGVPLTLNDRAQTSPRVSGSRPLGKLITSECLFVFYVSFSMKLNKKPNVPAFDCCSEQHMNTKIEMMCEKNRKLNVGYRGVCLDCYAIPHAFFFVSALLLRILSLSFVSYSFFL